jgi:hypothetical protein
MTTGASVVVTTASASVVGLGAISTGATVAGVVVGGVVVGGVVGEAVGAAASTMNAKAREHMTVRRPDGVPDSHPSSPERRIERQPVRTSIGRLDRRWELAFTLSVECNESVVDLGGLGREHEPYLVDGLGHRGAGRRGS